MLLSQLHLPLSLPLLYMGLHGELLHVEEAILVELLSQINCSVGVIRHGNKGPLSLYQSILCRTQLIQHLIALLLSAWMALLMQRVFSTRLVQLFLRQPLSLFCLARCSTLSRILRCHHKRSSVNSVIAAAFRPIRA